ncbi:CRISPR-associated protein, Cse3 family [Glycomyces sambucus]|uniref:CRISPR-associated protein, Cse3 family n=1 Tax=Glycomyces sambucus TaxID=380244 RepID=A0A1G9CME6_9ACTN|nr:type I-E CRISPR-associated protein Cas6/Cse3/CasE [Glycomyces sambucus]SDK52635.1 CRISPR-associated protein, Cse3 family [Glycomyces sambucus]
MTTSLNLVRITLNTASRDVQRDLSDAKQMHTTLMRLLPDAMGEDPRKQANLLFRVEDDPRGITVLAQASHPLLPSNLPTGYGTTERKDISPLLRALRAGMAVRYRIDLNPTRSERRSALTAANADSERPRRPRGIVRALTGADADTWWRERAAANGLTVHTLLPTAPAWPPPRNARTGRGAITFTLCRYDGIATITDPALLGTALTEGIGRAKPYGAGLLTILPGPA